MAEKAIPVKDEYRTIIEGFGLTCPADNTSCKRIIFFIHNGNSFFTGNQEARIKFLQEQEARWRSKRISIITDRVARTKRTGVVTTVVPLTNSELDLKAKTKKSRPAHIIKLELQWQDTQLFECIPVPSNGNGQPKSP